MDPLPHLAALDTFVSAVEHQTGTQQVRLGLHGVDVRVQAPLPEQQRGSVPPVVAIRLLGQSPVRVHGRVDAAVPVEGHRCRAPVQVHAGLDALLHQLGPQPRRRVAAPIIGPEGNGERLALIHQRRQGFLRIAWMGARMKFS